MDKNSERYKELRKKKIGLAPFTVEEVFASPLQPLSREIAGILEKFGLSTGESCEEIQGGRDSQVYKVRISNQAYALRLLPIRKCEQFAQEKKMIELASGNGVPVPKVLGIEKAGNHAAMLMEWAEGQTVLAALKERPENAAELGIEFGKTQAQINQISVPGYKGELRSWLTPSREEAEILAAIPAARLESRLLHLDFHPLNVLTDGTNITAVLDWANAAIGDGRFDIARTFSVFALAGPAARGKNSEVLGRFAEGWRAGYGGAAKPFERLEAMPLFYAWSGMRFKRDSEARLEEGDKAEIDKWVAGWLADYRKRASNP